jgi:hypothetical protein
MQQNYSKKIDPIQKASKNTASSVLDASSQSEALQRKANMASNAAQREEAPRPNNTGMPDNLKSGIESLSGFSMDDVRVHYNSSKPATVQALAYTQGTDIHVAPGQEKHLPHEAWHVAQQMAGRVSPTTNINGMPVNDNAGLEHEADVMGEKALKKHGGPIQLKKNNLNSFSAYCNAAQLLLDPSRLNVVGEDHDESGPRRIDEATFSRIKTESDQYKIETNFLDKKDRFGDPKHLRYKQLIIFIDILISLIHSNLIKQETIEFTREMKFRKISLLVSKLLYPIPDLESRMPELHKFIVQSPAINIPKAIKEINNILKKIHLEFYKNHLINLKFKLETINFYDKELDNLKEFTLRKRMNCKCYIHELMMCKSVQQSKLQHGYPGQTYVFFLNRVSEMLQKTPILHNNPLTEEISPLIEGEEYKKICEAIKDIRKKVAPKQYCSDVTKERSIAMHKAAQNPKYNNGVWKIGDLHRIDIESSFPKRNYNLISQENFNQEFTEWQKEGPFDIIPEKR